MSICLVKMYKNEMTASEVSKRGNQAGSKKFRRKGVGRDASLHE